MNTDPAIFRDQRIDAASPLQLNRTMIEAAIRANCFLGQYGDVPAVNGITVAADAIWALHCADLARVTSNGDKA